MPVAKPGTTMNVRPNQNESNNEMKDGNQVLSVLLLIGEILFIWLKATAELFISIYRTIVPPQEKPVKGEIILVTGAGHGIGKELALQFAALGATVVCWDINKKNNEQTVKEIKEIGYPTAYAYECDVSSRQTILEVAEKVKSEVGNVTILVNNAGIMPCHSLQDHSEQEIRKMFDINVFAHFWVTEAFLPSMLQNNRGHIVALSSMAGVLGVTNLVPYCASKFAVRGMMEAMREEMRETTANCNINFTTIYPYMVDTGLCKRPKYRFASLFAPLPVKLVAKKIIRATRMNRNEMSIPEYMFPINNFMRIMPLSWGQMAKDFFDSGLNTDL